MYASLRLDKTFNFISLLISQISIGLASFIAVTATQYFVYPFLPLSYFNFTLGVVLAFLFYSDLKAIPAILVGVLSSYHLLAIPFSISIFLALILVLECVVGAFILKHYLNFDSRLAKKSDVVSLILSMGLLITLISSLIESLGLTFLIDNQTVSLATVWLHNWMGKLTGVILVAPFFLVWSHPVLLRRSLIKTLELLLLFSVLLLLCGGVFLGWFAVYVEVYAGLPIAFILFPIIIWASFRFEQHIATMVCIILAAFCLWALDNSIGPFAYASVMEAFVLTWLCIITSSTLSLFLSADITTSKKIRVKLKQSDERLNFATHSSQDGLWDWSNTDKNYIWWSARFYQLLGYKEGELKNNHTTLLSLMHPDDKPRHLSMLKKHLNGEGAYNIDIRLRKKYIGYRWFHAKGEGSKDPKNKVYRMAGSIIDIDDRKKAEHEIKRLNSQLERKVESRTKELLQINHELRGEIQSREKAQAEQEKLRDQLLRLSRVSAMGELSSSLAHELHQPLMSIVNYSQSCLIDLNKSDLNQDITDNISIISKQALEAGSIIDRINSYLAKDPNSESIVSINDLIKDLRAILLAEAKKFDCELIFIFDQNDSCINANELQIQHLINNLCRNGMESMQDNVKKDKVLTIKVEASDAESVSVSIIDHAEKEFTYKSAMLDAFYSTKNENLGIGLSICKTIVLSHGGSLSLMANQVSGATAKFTLPIASPQYDWGT